jgi:hypothetical protein
VLELARALEPLGLKDDSLTVESFVEDYATQIEKRAELGPGQEGTGR